MSEREAVFEALRALMLHHSDGLDVRRDQPGDLVVRTRQPDAKGQPGWFGTVTARKSYVAFHLPPLYDHPALAEALSDELERRRQGKTCFNFKALEPAVLDELAALTERVRAAVDGA
ncbi:hypothetical protein [Brevundimonas poindexterae]|uniref:hypothetical protein n=1 Tax=Brevundimonas poindexterae TaxID=74325 RepID=UPI001CFD78EE|nr:hypothetical protein [Brevundimonas poindexterae]